MEFFFTAVAFLTAGVALLTGLFGLFSGLRKGGERMDLVFGILSMSVFVFLVLPPYGFVLIDKGPYSLEVCIKRLFIWNFYLMLPWFFMLYSGYKNRWLSASSFTLLVISYILMAMTKSDSLKPAWVLVALIPFTLILAFGTLAGFYLTRKGHKAEGRWLLAAMAIYAVLLFLGALNQLGSNYFGNLMGTKMFFPFHLNLLAFIGVMGFRLHSHSLEKLMLEKKLLWEHKRWDTVVSTMQLIIVELDREGRVLFINPFGMQLFGFRDNADAIGRYWFQTVFLPDDQKPMQAVYEEVIASGNIRDGLTCKMKSRSGLIHTVKWTAVYTYDRRGEISGTVSIGMDLTEQQQANQQIRRLKEELEKENLPLNGHLLEESREDQIIGESEAILYAIQKARKVAGTNAGVLLMGETGVGKELFAQMIHKHSLRCDKPCIKLNCAALPADLIESELFGHERGAFTGAIQSRKGRFELADGGTIFLDEIGELPLFLQSKLLRVLQSREIERIGGQGPQRVDVRVIAATNRDLQMEVKEGRFREDLFYRLNVFPITIPALRNRKQDIPALAAHFVGIFSARQGKKVTNISKADIMRLTEYNWPGNVREMENLLERSVISSVGHTLKLDWLLDSAKSEIHDEVSSFIGEVEKKHVLRILEECKWKINGEGGAAERLGLHPSTLRSRLKKMNINRNVG